MTSEFTSRLALATLSFLSLSFALSSFITSSKFFSICSGSLAIELTFLAVVNRAGARALNKSSLRGGGGGGAGIFEWLISVLVLDADTAKLWYMVDSLVLDWAQFSVGSRLLDAVAS